MSITISGKSYGCTEALEQRAYGIARAGRSFQKLLDEGGTLPVTYTIAGVEFNVVKVNITPNGSVSNQTALVSAYGASRSGTPTLLVLPPSSSAYVSSTTINISANTYVVGYGATIRKTLITNYAHIFQGDNAGIFGIRMIGPDGAVSKWPERHEADTTQTGSKDGTISKGSTGGVTNDAWIVSSNRANIIVMDNKAYGSLTGFGRIWGSGTNQLWEGNTMNRSHSDSIHFCNNITNSTARRNTIINAGDDAISVVAYAATPGPDGILVEYNEIYGGRARGLTVVGGRGVCHQYNVVQNINLAAFLYAAASSHSTISVTNTICRWNEAWRCGQKDANDAHSGIFAACFTYGDKVVDIDVYENKAFTWTPDHYASGAVFVRGTGGNVRATQNGNTALAIDATA